MVKTRLFGGYNALCYLLAGLSNVRRHSYYWWALFALWIPFYHINHRRIMQ